MVIDVMTGCHLMMSGRRSLPFFKEVRNMEWYVMQVRSGQERKIADRCRFLIPSEILHECFIPEFVARKKFRGVWKDVRCVLFTGYVFVITERIEELYVELKKIPDLTKIIGKKKDVIYPLKDGEVEFLKRFTGDDHLVDMSTGFIEGENIHISEGPLQGHEGMITKIDRHKRMAYISLHIFGSDTTAKVGLEIISKN